MGDLEDYMSGNGIKPSSRNSSVRQYGAKGDGVNDDTAAVNKAIFLNDGVIYFPPGTYKGNFTLKPGTVIAGAGKGVTTFVPNNPNNYVFNYQSPLTNSPEEKCPQFKDFTLQAKFGIKLNQSGNFATVFSLQAFEMYGYLQNVELVGTYPSQADPNRDTAIVPTEAEVEGYGIGLCLAKCFDFRIDKSSVISSFGVGATLDGCDISRAECRFIGNARHVYVYGHDTYGGGFITKDAEFLVNRRYGAVYLNGGGSGLLADSYYETNGPAGCYWLSNGDFQTRVVGNRITDPGSTYTVADFAPSLNLTVDRNTYEGATKTAVSKVSTANYSGNGTLCKWGANGDMPAPTNITQMIGNIASAATITIPDTDSKAFTVSGTTTIANITASNPGRIVTIQSSTGTILVQHFGGGSGNLRLAGSVDYSMTVGSSLTLMYTPTFGVWYEIGRSKIT